MAEFASALHDCPEHLVIASPGEQNLTRVEFEKSASNGPDVDSKIVWHAKNYSNGVSLTSEGRIGVCIY